MKETPVLMCGPMVLKTLADLKTNTRRVVDLPDGPVWSQVDHWKFEDGLWHAWKGGAMMNVPSIKCRYGHRGDRLWVKETHYLFGWWFRSDGKWHFMYERSMGVCFAENTLVKPITGFNSRRGWRKRPSIFMPRWATRIILEIADISVERLQRITETDALAEGVRQPCVNEYATDLFRLLWNFLNAGRGFSWDSNPWVWVIKFRRIQG